MGRKQVERYFEELYLGKNQKELVNSYYKQKKKEVLLILFAGIFLFLLFFYSEYKRLQLEEGKILYRKEIGKEEEIKLKVKREGKEWEDIKISLGSKDYTEDELENLYKKMIEALPEYILGNNESLDEITQNLYFTEEIENYPFYLNWESSDQKIIDNQGRIYEVKETSNVEISVRISYKEWEREHRFFVAVKNIENTEYINLLREFINKKEVKDNFITEIKNALGMGLTQNSQSTSSKVDLTIIIGKDYQ